MKTQNAFMFGETGLKELQNPALPVGQVVIYSNRYGDDIEAVIVAEDVRQLSCTYQQKCIRVADGGTDYVSATGPGELCAGWRLGDSVLSAEQLAAVLKIAEQNRVRVEAEQAAAAIAKEKARNAERAQLEKDFKHLSRPGEKLSSHACGAKNIRKELAAAFPGVKFSVRSDSYSGGDSITASWTQGPTSREVRAIIGKYSEGNFNGMEDIYESNEEQFPRMFGGAKYVSESRDEGDDAARLVALKLCEFYGVTPPADGKSFWQVRPEKGAGGGYDVGTMARQLILAQSYPAGAVIVDVERNPGVTAGHWEEFYHVVFTLPDGSRATIDTWAGKMSHYRAKYFDGYEREQFETAAAAVKLPAVEFFGRFCEWQAAQWESKAPAESITVENFAATLSKAATMAPVLTSPGPAASKAESGKAESGNGEPAAVVQLNAEKNGVEIKFPSKPAADVLARLKAAGWRWSRFSGCWYQRQTADNIAFAHSLAGTVEGKAESGKAESGNGEAAPVFTGETAKTPSTPSVEPETEPAAATSPEPLKLSIACAITGAPVHSEPLAAVEIVADLPAKIKSTFTPAPLALAWMN